MSVLSLVIAALAAISAGPPAQPVQPAGQQQIGTTNAGNPVWLVTKSVKKGASGIITATVRTVFVKPVKTAAGTITSSRTIAMFDCARQAVAVKESWLWFDEVKEKAFEHTKPGLPGFAPPIGGTLPAVAMKHLCAAR